MAKPSRYLPKPDEAKLKSEGFDFQEGQDLADPPEEFKPEIRELMKRLASRNDDKSVKLVPVVTGGSSFLSDNPEFNVPIDAKRKYSIEFIGKLARYGLTDEQICDVLGISAHILKRWARHDKQLAWVLRQGKEDADRMVAEALFRKALGFSYDESTVETKDEGGRVTVSEKSTRKFVPPDVQAAIMWLVNRNPQNWKAPAQVTVNDMRKTVIYKELAALDDRELEKVARSQN